MFKKRILSIILVLVMAFSMMGFTVSAEDETNTNTVCTCPGRCDCPEAICKQEQYTLIAGQNMDVGTIGVRRCADTLKIGIFPNKGWQLVEWHIDVATLPSGIPHNKNGSPIPGKFRFNNWNNFGLEPFECYIDLADDEINLASASVLYLAIHAVVQKFNPETCTWQQETAWGFNYCNQKLIEADGANWANYVLFPPQ